MTSVYTYRVSKGPELHSFTFHSLDPLPAYATLETVEYFATYARTQYTYWWVVGQKCGVSIDEAHARRSIRKWAKSLPEIPFCGRIARDADLELEGSEPHVLGDREDVSNA